MSLRVLVERRVDLGNLGRLTGVVRAGFVRTVSGAGLAAEREAVIGLRDDRVIGDEVLTRIERDLDLEALRSGA